MTPVFASLPYTDNLRLAECVAKGIPALVLDEMAKAFNLSPSALAPVVQMAPRTLLRRRASKALLKPDETERAVRLGRLLTLATDVLGDRDAAGEWFKRPLATLGGQAPLALCATEPGAREVEQVLGRLSHGVFA